MAAYAQGYPYDDDLDPETLIPGRATTTKSFVVALVVSLFVSVALFFALRGEAERDVPALVGYSLAKARTVLAKEGFSLVILAERPDPLVPAGSISLQDPVAGTRLTVGDSIIVLLSTGPRSEASRQPVAASSAAPTAVASKAPPAVAPALPVKTAEPVAKKARVAPTRESASPPSGPDVPMPKVTGMRLKSALSRLKRAGLALGSVSYRADEDHMPNYVLQQTPGAGATVTRGSKVQLVVNRTE